MIAICRTRTLRALRADLVEAQAATGAAQSEAEKYSREAGLLNDGLIRAEAGVEDLLRRVAETTAAVLEADREAEVLRRRLAEAEARAAAPRTVFVLLRRGALHSVHESRGAAEKAAVADGACACCWVAVTAGDVARSGYDEPWVIRPFVLGAAGGKQ
ncbi:hypothetical protein [Streptomyces cucumeris]|uniref:hypothetical protein n=1 Tax=Streptomyces cucumeris TaxID=2962890 RepID=UPI003D72B9CF